MTITEAINDDNIDPTEFYQVLQKWGKGLWDNVQGEEAILVYAKQLKSNNVDESHILQAIENSPYTELYEMSLSCSTNIPKPICEKQDLVNALMLGEEELQAKLEFEV